MLGAFQMVSLPGVASLSMRWRERSDGNPFKSTVAGMGVGLVQYQSKTPDIPGLEAQLGQMEYSLGALREQLAIVRQTIADYRKRKTVDADPGKKIPDTAIARL
jgi:hypothetical protein